MRRSRTASFGSSMVNGSGNAGQYEGQANGSLATAEDDGDMVTCTPRSCNGSMRTTPCHIAVDDSASRACATSIRRPSTRNTSPRTRSEEHTSELQSLLRIPYGVFCLKKKTKL